MYANKLVTTRRAMENKNTSRSQVMELASWWRGLTALLNQCVSFSLNGRAYPAGFDCVAAPFIKYAAMVRPR
eukprot:874979-Pelagomonas_calceolata.AAC.1